MSDNELISLYRLYFPVLRKWGATLNVPIALFADDVRVARNIISKISANALLINPSMRPEEVKKILKKANSEGFFLVINSANFFDSDKRRALFELLTDCTMTGLVDDEMLTGAVFIVFVGCVPQNVKGLVLEIHIDDTVELPDFVDEDYVISTDLFPVIRDKVDKLPDSKAKPFQAAALFRYTEISENELCDLLKKAEEINDSAEGYIFTDGLVEMASDLILRAVEQNNVIDLSMGESADGVNLDSCILRKIFDLYVPERLFAEILSPLIQMGYKISYLKLLLTQNQIIKGTPGHYTRRIFLSSSQRPYMINVDLEQINKIII